MTINSDEADIEPQRPSFLSRSWGLEVVTLIERVLLVSDCVFRNASCGDSFGEMNRSISEYSMPRLISRMLKSTLLVMVCWPGTVSVLFGLGGVQ